MNVNNEWVTLHSEEQHESKRGGLRCEGGVGVDLSLQDVKIILDVVDVSSDARGQVLAGVGIAEAVHVPLEVAEPRLVRRPFDCHPGNEEVVPAEGGTEDTVGFRVRPKPEVLHSVDDFAAFKRLKKSYIAA